MAPSIVDEDPAHHLRGDREKVRAIVPLNISLVDQTNECFVDKSRSLESVTSTLAVHVVMGQPVQLAIDHRRQVIKSCLVSVAPVQKQLSDVQLFAVVHQV